MLLKATATAFCMLFLGNSIPAALANDDNATRTGTVQIAQASPVTKFRGLFIGMTMSELDAAISSIRASKKPNLFADKANPLKFDIRRDDDTLGYVTITNEGRVEELSLNNTFFDIPNPISMREFAEKITKAYSIKYMKYELQRNPFGSFWAYRGESNVGEKLLIVDTMGINSPDIIISKSISGNF